MGRDKWKKGHEVALKKVSAINKPCGHFFVGNTGELFTGCDLVCCYCVAGFLGCGV